MRRVSVAVVLAVAVMIASFAPGALLVAIFEVGSRSSIHETAHQLLANHHAHAAHVTHN